MESWEGVIIESIDLNCDFGEDFGVYKLEDVSDILQYVTSVNIACGYHAGDPSTMRRAVEQAIFHDVKIGAHPGYPDLIGFGRREMDLDAQQIYDIVTYQIGALDAFLKKYQTTLHHVKLHGALYNKAAKNEEISEAVVKAVYNFSPKLKLYALANTMTVDVAKSYGLEVWQEGFIDRTYANDGSLTSRTSENSVITDVKLALDQVRNIILEGKVKTLTGEEISLNAQTLCIHGDNPNAVKIAESISNELKNFT